VVLLIWTEPRSGVGDEGSPIVIFSSICERSGAKTLQRAYAEFFPPLIALTAFSKIQNMDPFLVGDHTLMIVT